MPAVHEYCAERHWLVSVLFKYDPLEFNIPNIHRYAKGYLWRVYVLCVRDACYFTDWLKNVHALIYTWRDASLSRPRSPQCVCVCVSMLTLEKSKLLAYLQVIVHGDSCHYAWNLLDEIFLSTLSLHTNSSYIMAKNCVLCTLCYTTCLDYLLKMLMGHFFKQYSLSIPQYETNERAW